MKLINKNNFFRLILILVFTYLISNFINNIIFIFIHQNIKLEKFEKVKISKNDNIEIKISFYEKSKLIEKNLTIDSDLVKKLDETDNIYILKLNIHYL